MELILDKIKITQNRKTEVFINCKAVCLFVICAVIVTSVAFDEP